MVACLVLAFKGRQVKPPLRYGKRLNPPSKQMQEALWRQVYFVTSPFIQVKIQKYTETQMLLPNNSLVIKHSP